MVVETRTCKLVLVVVEIHTGKVGEENAPSLHDLEAAAEPGEPEQEQGEFPESW